MFGCKCEHDGSCSIISEHRRDIDIMKTKYYNGLWRLSCHPTTFKLGFTFNSDNYVKLIEIVGCCCKIMRVAEGFGSLSISLEIIESSCQRIFTTSSASTTDLLIMMIVIT